MSTTDYYMMNLRQKISSIKKFTSLDKLSAKLCPDAGFQILNGIKSYGDHVKEDAEFLVKRLQPRKEKKAIG